MQTFSRYLKMVTERLHAMAINTISIDIIERDRSVRYDLNGDPITFISALKRKRFWEAHYDAHHQCNQQRVAKKVQKFMSHRHRARPRKNNKPLIKVLRRIKVNTNGVSVKTWAWNTISRSSSHRKYYSHERQSYNINRPCDARIIDMHRVEEDLMEIDWTSW